MATLTKYRVLNSSGYTEFASSEDASVFAAEHSGSVEEVTETLPGAYVPPTVTPRQIRLALLSHGITAAAIETALGSLSEPTRSVALIEWDYSLEFQRYRPLVTAVGSMLGWTSEQLDDLWRLANTL